LWLEGIPNILQRFYQTYIQDYYTREIVYDKKVLVNIPFEPLK